MNRLANAFVISILWATAMSFAAADATDQQIARMNNEGVRKLNAGEYLPGIELFERAIKLDPDYSYAKDNLAVALTNYALTLPAERAVVLLRKALQVSPRMLTTEDKLQATLKALKAKNQQESPTKEDLDLLKSIPPEAFPSSQPPPDSAQPDKPAPAAQPSAVGGAGCKPSDVQPRIERNVTAATPNGLAVPGVDFGLYMQTLQRQIKKHWSPCKESEPRRVKVTFKITEVGELKNLEISQPSGSQSLDLLALKAVTDAAPFDPLPKGSPKEVDILLTLDCNIFVGGEAGNGGGGTF
jgi:TonB family protein